MVDIKRPEFLRGNGLQELLRWNKHTTDNIDRLKDRFTGHVFTLTHGVEMEVPSPVAYTVTRGIACASYVVGTSTVGLPVESVAVRQISSTTLGITAYFRYTYPTEFISMRNSVDQLVAAGDVDLVYDTIQVQVGSGISYSGGVFTVSRSGIYQVNTSYYYLSDGAAFSDIRTGIVAGTQDYWTLGYSAPLFPVDTVRHPQQLSHAVSVAASGTIKARTNHGAAGVRNIDNTGGDARFHSRITIAKIAPITTEETGSYDVSLILLDD